MRPTLTTAVCPELRGVCPHAAIVVDPTQGAGERIELAELSACVAVRQTAIRLLQTAIRDPIREEDLPSVRDKLSLAVSAETTLSPEVGALLNTQIRLSGLARRLRVPACAWG